MREPHRITIQGPQLRADRLGYLIGGDYMQGFADRTDFKRSDRHLIARWCLRFTPELLTTEQRPDLFERCNVDRPRQAS